MLVIGLTIFSFVLAHRLTKAHVAYRQKKEEEFVVKNWDDLYGRR